MAYLMSCAVETIPIFPRSRARYVLTVLTLRESAAAMTDTDFPEPIMTPFPARHRFDGLDELFGGIRLGEIRGGSVPQAAYGVLFLRIHAEHDDLQRRLLGFENLENIQPSSARHRDIEDGDVELLFLRQLEGFLTVCGLSCHDHVGILRDDLLQSFSHYTVVISDQDADHARDPSGGSGIVTVRVVPIPGRPRIDISPRRP